MRRDRKKEKREMTRKKGKEEKIIIVEYKVSMHCNACERTVANAVHEIKGVEKFVTDMRNHKVMIQGKINPRKVLKILRKKTGKRVEMMVGVEDSNSKEDSIDESDALGGGIENPKEIMHSLIFNEWVENIVFTMFSDENPNACFLM
ncbi:Heavy metal-associated domain, HMA [Dillenia turbinata]|uniref:Heavy metal-associated domain, HMA n=1 Tax=Dillenia turbinata TaxID=194707 RepID=A0AAN8Z9V8_9MAGN